MNPRKQGILFSVLVAASVAAAQNAEQKALPGGEHTTPLLRVTSTFVSVPVLARDSSGTLLDHWRTDGVELVDNAFRKRFW